MSSIPIINSHAARSLLAIVIGFLVEIRRPAKNDWEIPIYKTGSILSIRSIDNIYSNISKSRQFIGIFEFMFFKYSAKTIAPITYNLFNI